MTPRSGGVGIIILAVRTVKLPQKPFQYIFHQNKGMLFDLAHLLREPNFTESPSATATEYIPLHKLRCCLQSSLPKIEQAERQAILHEHAIGAARQGKRRGSKQRRHSFLSKKKKKGLVLLRTSVQSFATHKRCSSKLSVFNS